MEVTSQIEPKRYNALQLDAHLEKKSVSKNKSELIEYQEDHFNLVF